MLKPKRNCFLPLCLAIILWSVSQFFLFPAHSSQAAIDHLLLLQSQVFVGNRRSSLDVYIKEERLNLGLKSYFYEYGDTRTSAEQLIGHDYGSINPPEITNFKDRHGYWPSGHPRTLR
eukprot:TRINITY_DN8887_c0_g1_i1.p1 TRINITY_DN8887_c0_g1~~TRINITY_DN8887_c0_g1_i1.p1  ORF type:complete len:118 (+),score=20.08 TRINITY_DN8887_c0_g1_i1:77-430(+)